MNDDVCDTAESILKKTDKFRDEFNRIMLIEKEKNRNFYAVSLFGKVEKAGLKAFPFLKEAASRPMPSYLENFYDIILHTAGNIYRNRKDSGEEWDREFSSVIDAVADKSIITAILKYDARKLLPNGRHFKLNSGV